MSNSTLVYTTRTGQVTAAEHARVAERIYSAAVKAALLEAFSSCDDQVDDPCP